jgi:arylsulfatase A-like enzyme
VQNFFDCWKVAGPSTATHLRRAGYHTAYFGKWHIGVQYDQTPPGNKGKNPPIGVWYQRTTEDRRAGFEDWFAFEVNNTPFDGYYYHQNEVNPRPLPGYQTDALTDMAIDYLRSYDGDEPLFLVLSIEPPHFPLDAPERFKRFDPNQLILPPNFVDTPKNRADLATYYAMIENLDWNIGRLMEAMGGLDRFKRDTLTIYFSDHGDFMGSHGLSCQKTHPHEESTRIPAIFHYPGVIPAMGDIDGLFSLVDLFATTLSLAGAPVPSYQQGTDWAPKLLGEKFDGPEAVLLEMQGSPHWTHDYQDWRGFTDARWKYAFYENGAERFYDLQSDPWEMNDLGGNEALCRPMRQRLLKMLAEAREPYFDVIMQDPAPRPPKTLDVSPWPGPVLTAGMEGRLEHVPWPKEMLR